MSNHHDCDSLTCIVMYTSFILLGQGSVTNLGDLLLTAMVDILTTVRALNSLFKQPPKKTTTMTAKCWAVVVLDIELVSMSLLHVCA